jgi:SAM-dependent methyltransferase
MQMDHFDSIGVTELEINRPHGCGQVYNFLLEEKFEIVTGLLERVLEGNSVLNLCCGSGMDAEFLARSGAEVVGVDISIGALRGAKERAERYGVKYDLVVGDAERLPVQDKSFDIAFVHDGLHHLDSPELGFQEMVRTSSGAILITEPAKAFATEIGIKLGLADSVEESGSRVYRFSELELLRLCAEAGLKVPKIRRYAMYYRQDPLKVFRIFERDWAFTTFVFLYRFVNLILGRMGNKIALVAER